MRVKQHFYIVTVVLLATLLTLSIGSQIKFDINNLSAITMDESEKSTRAEMKALLQVAREAVTQNIKFNNTDISTDEGVKSLIEECIKPLNIESSSSSVVLMQVRPDVKVLYQKRATVIPDELVKYIQTGIDSTSADNKTFTINNSDKIFEWVGIPPGVSDFDKGNVKWVLILKKDKSVVESSIKNIITLQQSMIYRLYSILIISCLVVLTTVLTIYSMQKFINNCPKKDSCPYLKKPD